MVPFPKTSLVEQLLNLLNPFLPSGHRQIPTLFLSSIWFLSFLFCFYFRWFVPYSFNYLPIPFYRFFFASCYFTWFLLITPSCTRWWPAFPGCFSSVYHRKTAFSLPPSYSIFMYVFIVCLIILFGSFWLLFQIVVFLPCTW